MDSVFVNPGHGLLSHDGSSRANCHFNKRKQSPLGQEKLYNINNEISNGILTDRKAYISQMQ